ncbi:MAG: TipAS antibiotic-recognition domain-containing protein [Clostridia bacterium]|nr:TipAS antibiotic-recognition domain-containing protein [Clostridia bacterium]
MKNFNDNYKAEVQEKWGKTEAYKEYSHKTSDYTEEKYSLLAEKMNDIFAEFAVCMKSGKKPDSDNAQSLVKKLQTFITENYYTCTKEILSGLGQMYVLDERFRTNIDKNADGTAEYAGSAIRFYCG